MQRIHYIMTAGQLTNRLSEATLVDINDDQFKATMM